MKVVRDLWWYLREVSGESAYDKYLARVRRDRHEQRRFLPARHAPRGPHIEHRDATLKLRTVEAGHRLAVALEAGKRRQIGPRGRMSDQGRGDARRIAGAEPQYEQCGEREERDERHQHEHAASPRARIFFDYAGLHQFTTSPRHRVASGA